MTAKTLEMSVAEQGCEITAGEGTAKDPVLSTQPCWERGEPSKVPRRRELSVDREWSLAGLEAGAW